MVKQPAIDVRPEHWLMVQKILLEFVPNYEIWAFGSRAKNKAKKHSDLDLAIIANEPLTLEITGKLNDAFSESDLPWKVDIVDWTCTSASFREVIERDKVVVQKATSKTLTD